MASKLLDWKKIKETKIAYFRVVEGMSGKRVIIQGAEQNGTRDKIFKKCKQKEKHWLQKLNALTRKLFLEKNRNSFDLFPTRFQILHN